MREGSERERPCARWKAKNSESVNDRARKREIRRTEYPTWTLRYHDTGRSEDWQTWEGAGVMQVWETEVKIGAGNLVLLPLVPRIISPTCQHHMAMRVSNTRRWTDHT